VLVILKIDAISLTICSSSKEMESIFDPNFAETSKFFQNFSLRLKDVPLSRALITNSEILLETNKFSRTLVLKSRIGAASLISPPPVDMVIF
jgi:hypothetical protein